MSDRHAVQAQAVASVLLRNANGRRAAHFRPALSLLLTSTAAIAISASGAEAACNPSGSTVLCTPEPGEYPNGIDYQNDVIAAPGVSLVLDSGITVNNTAGQDGVSIEQSGNVSLTTNGPVDINVAGAAADRDGVRVDSTNNGTVTVNVQADITTNNVEGDGLIARSNTVDNEDGGWDDGRAKGAGSVTVISSGDILTQGNMSTGITAGSSGLVVSVTNSGDVTTMGAVESGAIVATNNRTGAGAVNSQTNVTVTGANLSTQGTQSAGVAATSASGRTTINVTGGTVQTQGFQSIGIGGGTGLTSLTAVGTSMAAFSPTGSVLTINNGTAGAALNDGATVQTAGNWGFGVAGLSRGGAVNILNRGNISTTGDVGGGIVSMSAFVPLFGTAKGGALSVDNRANITTTGDSSHAIGVVAISSDINIVSSGALSTGGGSIPVPEFSSLGVEVRSSGIQAAVSRALGFGGNGNIAVTTTDAGTIQTSGVAAHGIDASAFGGTITINAAGAITTTGGQSDGIIAQTTTGAIRTTTAAIQTSGADADGVNALSTGGLIAVDADAGDIATAGAAAHGIVAQTTTGALTVASRNITTAGAGSDGVRSTTTTGATGINTTAGVVSTAGPAARGVAATTTTGALTIATADVTTLGQDADGLVATTTSGAILADTSGGTVHTSGASAGGMNAQSASGTIGILTADVTTLGDNSIGVSSLNSSGATAIDTNGGSIRTAGAGSTAIMATAQTGGVDILTGAVTTAGSDALGVRADITDVAGAGSIGVQAAGPVQTSGSGSTGIRAQVHGSGGIDVVAAAPILTAGGQAGGIFTQSVVGDTTVTSAQIGTLGNDADAINADTDAGALTVKATGGNVSTAGDNSSGLRFQTVSGAADLRFADIATAGAGARGVVGLTDSGAIAVTGGVVETAGDNSDGFDLTSLSGNILVDTGAVLTRGTAASGVVAQTSLGAIEVRTSGAVLVQGLDAAGIEARGGDDVSIVPGANVTARGRNGAAVFAASGAGATEVLVAPGLNVQGGWSALRGDVGAGGLPAAGVIAGGVNGAIVENRGEIGALSDLAVASSDLYGGPGSGGGLTIENFGTITGSLRLAAASGAAQNVFNNYSPDSFNLRGFADTNGDGTRDTEMVAIADIGGPAAEFNNLSNGVVRLSHVPAATADTSGQYTPAELDPTFHNIATAGVEQGAITNLSVFRNAGIITLQDLETGGTGPVAGDVLIITGSATPGVAGGGLYVSEGGRLHLDTVLNAGMPDSRSDVLVLDGTMLGASGPTSVFVTNAGGPGAFTPDEGVKIVDVLVPANSASGVFTLGERVVAGPYEYSLFRGGVTDPDGDWYLRSARPQAIQSDPGPNPQPDPGANPGGVPAEPVEPLYRSEAAVYLGVQRAAGGLVAHTLHERLGESQFAELGKETDADGDTEERNSAWLRIVGHHGDLDHGKSAPFAATTDEYLLHGGLDFFGWEDDEGDDRLNAGLMGAYGRSFIDGRAAGNAAKAKGRADTYLIGTYATWYDNEEGAPGLYADLWGQIGEAQNTIRGQGLPEEEYDSDIWAGSLEVGYAFEADETYKLMAEPQAQLVYTHYQLNAFEEGNGTLLSNGANGQWASRLGLRLHRTDVHGQQEPSMIQAALEFNWWHDFQDQSIAFNGESIELGMPRDRFDVGGAMNAALDETTSLWANTEIQFGRRYVGIELIAGVRVAW